METRRILLEEEETESKKADDRITRELLISAIKAFSEGKKDPYVNYELKTNKQRDYLNLKKYNMIRDPPNPSMRTATTMNKAFPIVGIKSKLEKSIPKVYEGVKMYDETGTDIGNDKFIKASAACLNFFSLTKHERTEERLEKERTAMKIFKMTYSNALERCRVIPTIKVKEVVFGGTQLERRNIQTNDVIFDVPSGLHNKFICESIVPQDVGIKETLPQSMSGEIKECRNLLSKVPIKNIDIKAKIVKNLIDKRVRNLPTNLGLFRAPLTSFATTSDFYTTNFTSEEHEEIENIQEETIRTACSIIISTIEDGTSKKRELEEKLKKTTISGIPLTSLLEKTKVYSPEILIAKASLNLKVETLAESNNLMVKKIEGTSQAITREVVCLTNADVRMVRYKEYKGEEKFFFRTKKGTISGTFEKGEGMPKIIMSGKLKGKDTLDTIIEILFFCRRLECFSAIPSDVRVKKEDKDYEIFKNCLRYYKRFPREGLKYLKLRNRRGIGLSGDIEEISFENVEISEKRISEPKGNEELMVNLDDDLNCLDINGKILAQLKQVMPVKTTPQNIEFNDANLDSNKSLEEGLRVAIASSAKENLIRIRKSCQSGDYPGHFTGLRRWFIPSSMAGRRNLKIDKVASECRRMISEMFQRESYNKRDLALLWTFANISKLEAGTLTKKIESRIDLRLMSITGKLVDPTCMDKRSIIEKRGEDKIVVAGAEVKIEQFKTSGISGFSELLVKNYNIIRKLKRSSEEIMDTEALVFSTPEVANIEIGGEIFQVKRRKKYKHTLRDLDYNTKLSLEIIKNKRSKEVQKIITEEMIDESRKRKRLMEEEESMVMSKRDGWDEIPSTSKMPQSKMRREEESTVLEVMETEGSQQEALDVDDIDSEEEEDLI